jgi:hypothetical protein
MKNILLTSLSLIIGFIGTSQIGPVTDICVATVDETYSHNIVVWERDNQISPLAAIDSIFIYRRTLDGTDSLIAGVKYSDLSEYHDLDANPNLRPYMYRIAGKDVNGVVGPLSAPAQTIHFVIVEDALNNLWLKWTPYIGKPFNFYQCWDLPAGGGNSILVNSTSNNQDTAWNFTTAVPQVQYDMVVDVDFVNTCTSTKANHNTTRSNQASGIKADGLNVEELKIQNVILAPNPANGNMNVTFSSQAWTPITIKVYDISGRIVKQMSPIKVLGQHSVNIDLEDVQNGIYQLVIDNGTFNSYRFMKN